jgi:ribonuclease Y
MNPSADMSIEIPWLLPALYWIVGLAFGYFIHIIAVRYSTAAAEQSADTIIAKARHEAEVILREAEVKARDEHLRAREAVETENRQRRQDIAAHDQRLTQRESALDERTRRLQDDEQTVRARLTEAVQAATAQQEKLQIIAGWSVSDARRELLARLETELTGELASLVRKRQEETAATAAQKARQVIVTAIERYAAEQVSEATTTTVLLPSEETKGRLIGREGRNIRSLEAAMGVNVIIDDTPGVVVLSSFDPLRREVARQAMERLIADGRIHPARIEEIMRQVQAEMSAQVLQTGEEAALRLGLQGIATEVLAVVGRLRFRHSYGQNVLTHSIEMAQIMGMMAAELGLDVATARRCGLLHDLGKALDQSHEGGHAVAGAEFLRRHGEPEVVVNAVAAHHNDVPGTSVYAELTRAGDAITAARPGARLESTEVYLKRLEKLEEVARGFAGVQRCFALEAGREIRVIVEPAQIDDAGAILLAREIARAIEQHIDYPGQIKVSVIRETRCTEYAR